MISVHAIFLYMFEVICFGIYFQPIYFVHAFNLFFYSTVLKAQHSQAPTGTNQGRALTQHTVQVLLAAASMT